MQRGRGRLYYWLLISPLLAAASALVLNVVSRFTVKLDDGLSWGLVLGAPVLSWVAGYVIAIALERACVTSNAIYGVVVIIMPVAVGVATVLVAFWLQLRRSRQS